MILCFYDFTYIALTDRLLSMTRPKIITVNSLKGGVSKSTLALNLYYYLASQGKVAGIVDADPQGSLTEELAEREDVPLVSRQQIRDWESFIQGLEGDYILIDTAPSRDAKETESIFSISDFILMPCTPSVADVRALIKTIGTYEKVKARHPNLYAAVVLTQIKSGTLIGSELRDHLKEINLPVLAAEMHDRTDYRVSFSYEEGIFSTGNKKAVQEIKAIMIELENLMHHVKA